MMTASDSQDMLILTVVLLIYVLAGLVFLVGLGDAAPAGDSELSHWMDR